MPPSTQDTIEAGPASFEAVSAPNSQPEPMIDPTPANSRPTRPTSRRIPRSSTATARRSPAGAAEA